ncbi:PilW family protein [Hyalangium rubrum]|uniref:Prepilin-type N-terminal cleavage/methylation domain-containing protein n=1 Tax=Hyalangium rubrum TaxID=3103134 RepID=A0ABU5H1S5_9BACT|nr:prepilin-type N-terminal cleavage/methylation domain-containing protein [Hyalangium sp. s54d21]MDY7227406.1 prepilin-type N-terminal cleavage/methylation domain-containing protein [Hyalangium sp. s54d21]
MVARTRARRGFTLIEVLVASGVGLIILTAMMGYLLHRSRMDQREAQLGRLKQDASLLLGQLGRELRQAGLGRPTRARREGLGELYPGPLILADETALVFVSDLPRPDSNLNGVSAFAANQAFPPLPDRGVALLNELNGSCDVDGSGAKACRTDEASLLFAGPGQDCRDFPHSSPTCPWGLNKYQAGEWLVLVDGAGRWVERQVSSSVFGNAIGRLALVFDEPIPRDFFEVPNRGWVASLDRVFYRLEGGAVERKQCWERVGVQATLSGLSRPCRAKEEGTPWEPLLRTAAPGGLVFRYFDAQGVEFKALPLAPMDLRRVRRVEVALRLMAPASGEPVTYDTFSAFTLRH